VKQEWEERQNTSAQNRAIDRGMLFFPPINILARQAAGNMGARDYSHRSIFDAALIEVNPDCDHPLEDCHRRLYVWHTLLY